MFLRPILFTMMVLSSTTSCVSVSLSAADSSKRASGVNYREPSDPFVRQTRQEVDAAWKNPKNGNVISYLSDCKDPSDPPLDNIVQSVLTGLNDIKIESREVVTMQGREGRRVMASGKVDGVASSLDMLVYKRNQCMYILNYVGVSSAFAADRAKFQKFTEGFSAP